MSKQGQQAKRATSEAKQTHKREEQRRGDLTAASEAIKKMSDEEIEKVEKHMNHTVKRKRLGERLGATGEALAYLDLICQNEGIDIDAEPADGLSEDGTYKEFSDAEMARWTAFASLKDELKSIQTAAAAQLLDIMQDLIQQEIHQPMEVANLRADMARFDEEPDGAEPRIVLPGGLDAALVGASRND